MILQRPAVTWLLDSADATGTTNMALRRMVATDGVLRNRALALRAGSRQPRRGTVYERIERAPSAPTAWMTRRPPHTVVTTSPTTLSWAARNTRPSTRVVHTVHTEFNTLLGDERFLANIGRVTQVLVPVAVDVVEAGQQLGLEPDRVVTADDFTLPTQTVLSSGREKVIAVVGSLTGAANLEALIDAVSLTGVKLHGWQIRLYGDGPRRESLEERICATGVGDRILLMGSTARPAQAVAQASVLVRPGGEEANGLSVYEALAAGVPVVGASAVPAVSRRVIDGDNGMVLTRTDPQALADALTAVVDPGVRGRLAAGARRHDTTGLTAVDRIQLLGILLGRRPDSPPGAN